MANDAAMISQMKAIKVSCRILSTIKAKRLWEVGEEVKDLSHHAVDSQVSDPSDKSNANYLRASTKN